MPALHPTDIADSDSLSDRSNQLLKDLTASDRAGDRVVARYFLTLNEGSFQTTASLFTEDGTLYPPFEKAIVGQDAIADYLQTEANGMRLEPFKLELKPMDLGDYPGDYQYDLKGKVHTSLFSVNVGWGLILNSQSQIISAKVKLLAALKELLELKK